MNLKRPIKILIKKRKKRKKGRRYRLFNKFIIKRPIGLRDK